MASQTLFLQWVPCLPNQVKIQKTHKKCVRRQLISFQVGFPWTSLAGFMRGMEPPGVMECLPWILGRMTLPSWGI